MGSDLRPTVMVSKASGSGMKWESNAPCRPSACHRAILSLHARLRPGISEQGLPEVTFQKYLFELNLNVFRVYNTCSVSKADKSSC